MNNNRKHTGNRLNIRILCALAMMSALMALMAQIAVPIGAVPITLQTAGLIMATLLFGKRDALLAMLIYVLLGAVGLPVFSGGRGGLAMIAGPTGGFLLGFILAAFAGAAYYRQAGEGKTVPAFTAVLIALLISYTWGALHFMLVMGMGLKQTLTLAVLPFLPFELIKAAIFVPVSLRILRSLHQQFPAVF